MKAIGLNIGTWGTCAVLFAFDALHVATVFFAAGITFATIFLAIPNMETET